ncbi:AAA family ATPase [Flavobacterium sp. FlaQc-50]|jgi:energy-coupling factor transporter ATP-binding protein EcfA2|uniref:AAA family ATPase n=1 Tax=unclassified Flavobacterium TaxID=196869 RepID=UPI0037583DD3
MKIKSLWVSEYKNLKNIDLKFNSDLITLLVGQNGLGKSNLIEIFGTIFQSIDLFKTEEEIINWSRKLIDNHFEYSINYECNDNDINITVKDDFYEIKSRSITSNEVTLFDFKKFFKHKNQVLPKFIIGYYSGENKRIKKIVETHERKEKNNQINYFRRKTKPNQELRKIFFAESQHGKLILLTLALYKNHLQYGKIISKLFNEYLNINEVNNFKIVFNNPKSKGYIFLEKGIEEFPNKFYSDRDDDKNPFWNLKGKLHTLLSVFYDYGMNENKVSTYLNENEYRGRHIREIMELEKIDIQIFQEYICDKFERPLDFFDALESAQVMDVLTDIEIYVGNESNSVNFSGLSEGQLQLITVIGLILITGNKDCLFLFDEPDTHINPKWQRIFVDIIKEFNFNGNHSHVFVATHSPLIVQSYEDNDLFLFRKEADQIIIDTDNHKIINWRIDQVLLSEYFELPNARPRYLDDFMFKRLEIIEKRELSEEDVIELKKHENDFNVLPTGETLTDIKTLITINKITDKFDGI